MVGSRVMGALWCAALVGIGCGASPRMLHQSNVYYERCNAADFDPARTFEQRTACWEAWLEHYATGQPSPRVRHAEARRDACQAGEAVDALPDLDVTLREDSPTPNEGRLVQTEGVESDPVQTEIGESWSTNDTSDPEGDPPVQVRGVRTEARTTTDGEIVLEAEVAEPERIRAPALRRIGTGSAPNPCNEVCLPRWDSCVHRCRGRSSACVDACRSDHHVCMGGCG